MSAGCATVAPSVCRVPAQNEQAPAFVLIDEIGGWLTGLDDLFARFAHRFGRAEPRRQARHYLLGLLSPLADKNGWTLAEAAGDPTPDKMQRLLNRACWNPDAERMDYLRREIEPLFPNATVMRGGGSRVGVAAIYRLRSNKNDEQPKSVTGGRPRDSADRVPGDFGYDGAKARPTTAYGFAPERTEFRQSAPAVDQGRPRKETFYYKARLTDQSDPGIVDPRHLDQIPNYQGPARSDSKSPEALCVPRHRPVRTPIVLGSSIRAGIPVPARRRTENGGLRIRRRRKTLQRGLSLVRSSTRSTRAVTRNHLRTGRIRGRGGGRRRDGDAWRLADRIG